MYHRGGTKEGWSGSSVVLSEIASFQMEYRYLAHLTGKREYFHAVRSHVLTVLCLH